MFIRLFQVAIAASLVYLLASSGFSVPAQLASVTSAIEGSR